jgi:hypothetical protein
MFNAPCERRPEPFTAYSGAWSRHWRWDFQPVIRDTEVSSSNSMPAHCPALAQRNVHSKTAAFSVDNAERPSRAHYGDTLEVRRRTWLRSSPSTGTVWRW